MDNPIQVDLGRIAQDLQIRRVQVESVVRLLDDGNTVPFITRYRKEVTGNLNEVIIREIQLRVQRLRDLAERKETILKTIEAQGKLDPDLTAAIRAADNPKRLEDLYLPFKPKKRTKASDARDRGLEPLAFRVWTRDETLTDLAAAAQEFVSPEKGIESVEKVLEGVGHILAEAISEMAAGARRGAKGRVEDRQDRHRQGGNPRRPRSGISRLFRLLGAGQPRSRHIACWPSTEVTRKVRSRSGSTCLGPRWKRCIFGQLPLDGHPHVELFRAAAIDALDRLILPSMEREVRRDLTEAAERHAVEVFAKNLRSLLLQPPIPKQIVLAIDPGFRTGCKLAVLDRERRALDQGVIYPHPPQNRRSEAKVFIKDLVGKAQGRGRGDRKRDGMPRNRGADRRDHRRGNSVQPGRGRCSGGRRPGIEHRGSPARDGEAPATCGTAAAEPEANSGEARSDEHALDEHGSAHDHLHREAEQKHESSDAVPSASSQENGPISPAETDTEPETAAVAAGVPRCRS